MMAATNRMPLLLIAACISLPSCGDDGAPGSGTTATGGSTGTMDGVDETSTTEGMAVDPCVLGATVFDETMVHTLSLELSDQDWAAMIDEAATSPEYGGPPKTYFDANAQLDGVALDSPVAVRLKGHYSLLVAVEQGHSFPLKLDIDRVDPDLTLDGLTKVNLHPNLDGITSINEYLSYGAIRAHGVPTARVGFARVTVNGESLGLYSMVEHMQGKFIRCHEDEPYGDLYKPEEPIGNLAWQGPNISDYEPLIQFKWPDSSTTDHASILNLLDVINHQGVESFEGVLDVTEALTYLAMNVGLGNFDYYASFGHNYYLYEVTPGRFTMYPWDMNLSQTVMDHPCGFGRNEEQWPISNKLLADPAYVQQYLGILQEFLEGAGSPSALNQRLDDVLPLLGDDVDMGRVEELREAIDLRVSLQLSGISEAPQQCPEFFEDGGDACDECIFETCEAEIVACEEDPDCDCVLECVSEDVDEATCLGRCGLADTPAAFDDVITCIFGGCTEACR